MQFGGLKKVFWICGNGMIVWKVKTYSRIALICLILAQPGQRVWNIFIKKWNSLQNGIELLNVTYQNWLFDRCCSQGNILKQDKVNNAYSAFIFLIIQSQNKWSGRLRWPVHLHCSRLFLLQIGLRQQPLLNKTGQLGEHHLRPPESWVTCGDPSVSENKLVMLLFSSRKVWAPELSPMRTKIRPTIAHTSR